MKISPLSTEHGAIYVEIMDADLSTEIYEESAGTPKKASRDGTQDVGIIDKRLVSLKEILTTVTANVQDAFKESIPDEVKVEVKIGFAGNANPIPFIVNSKADAAFTVSCTWKKESNSK